MRIGIEYKVMGGERNSQSLTTVALSSLVNANADIMLLHHFAQNVTLLLSRTFVCGDMRRMDFEFRTESVALLSFYTSVTEQII